MKTDKQTLSNNLRKYKIERYIDEWLPIFFLSLAFFWLTQSILTIMLAHTIFTAIHLWLTPITMHVTTSLNCTVIYIVSYLFYRTFFLGHDRIVRALLFTVLGVIFYDTTWSALNLAINGYGSYLLPLVSTFVVAFYLWVLNRQQKILDLNWKRIVPVVTIYVGTLIVFVYSGFFQQWGLYEHGLASDPTGWAWLLNKTIALWMWLAFALR